MSSIIVRLLIAVEQLIVWVRIAGKNYSLTKLNKKTHDALTLSQQKKDTSKIDELFNSDKKP